MSFDARVITGGRIGAKRRIVCSRTRGGHGGARSILRQRRRGRGAT